MSLYSFFRVLHITSVYASFDLTSLLYLFFHFSIMLSTNGKSAKTACFHFNPSLFELSSFLYRVLLTHLIADTVPKTSKFFSIVHKLNCPLSTNIFFTYSILRHCP